MMNIFYHAIAVFTGSKLLKEQKSTKYTNFLFSIINISIVKILKHIWKYVSIHTLWRQIWKVKMKIICNNMFGIIFSQSKVFVAFSSFKRSSCFNFFSEVLVCVSYDLGT